MLLGGNLAGGVVLGEELFVHLRRGQASDTFDSDLPGFTADVRISVLQAEEVLLDVGLGALFFDVTQVIDGDRIADGFAHEEFLTVVG